jgi:hypothetical protein
MASQIVRKDGTVVFVVHLTFKPGHDDDLIKLVYASPRRFLASRLREAMHKGIDQQTGHTSQDQNSQKN